MDKETKRKIDEQLITLNEVIRKHTWEYHARLGKAYGSPHNQTKDLISLGLLGGISRSINEARTLLSDIEAKTPEEK